MRTKTLLLGALLLALFAPAASFAQAPAVGGSAAITPPTILNLAAGQILQRDTRTGGVANLGVANASLMLSVPSPEALLESRLRDADAPGNIIMSNIQRGFVLTFLTLSGCTAGQQASVTADLATPAGQLFCSVETAAGPMVFAAIDAASGGAAIIATGATASYVASACAAAKIKVATSTPVPVSPPAAPAAAPKVAVVVPTS